jgi:hypothetical protein
MNQDKRDVTLVIFTFFGKVIFVHVVVSDYEHHHEIPNTNKNFIKYNLKERR